MRSARGRPRRAGTPPVKVTRRLADAVLLPQFTSRGGPKTSRLASISSRWHSCCSRPSPRQHSNIRETEATMRIDTLETLFLEEIQDIRSVEKQILEALIRIAKGVSPQ